VLDGIDKTADTDFADLLPHRWKPPPKPTQPPTPLWRRVCGRAKFRAPGP
jgi:hypothetical protein